MKKIMNMTLGLCALAFASGCGLSRNDGAQVADDSNRPKAFGEGYNAGEGRFLNNTCLKVDPSNIHMDPPKLGKLDVTVSADAKKLEELFNINGNVKVDLKSFQAEGSAKFVSEMQASSFASTVVIHYNVTKGYKQIVDTAMVKLNPLGESVLLLPDEQKVAKCGTHYVRGKTLMAQFVAVMKFEFQNESQKRTFDGALKANISGVGNVAAQVEMLAKSARNSGSFSLSAQQLGGDASQLTKVLDPENMSGCILRNDPVACGKQIDSLVKYAQETLPAQFATPGVGFAETDEDLALYNDIEGWNGTPPNEMSLRALASARQDFRRLMDAEEGDYLRVQALLKNGAALTDEQAQKLGRISTTLIERMNTIAEESNKCFNISLDRSAECRAAYDSMVEKLKNDANLQLDRAAFIVIPASYLGWCSVAKQWYDVNFGSGEIAGNELAANLVLASGPRTSLPMVLGYDGLLKKPLRFEKAPENCKPDLEQGCSSDYTYIPELKCAQLESDMAMKRDINLRGARIVDTSVLSAFNFARSIDLSGGDNQIRSLVSLSRIPGLRKLVLDESNFLAADFSVLRNTAIQDLSLKNLNIGFDGDTGPDEFGVSHNAFSEISGMGNLMTLDLSGNDTISSFEKLKNLPRLNRIVLHGNSFLEETGLNELLARKTTDFRSLRQISVDPASLVCGLNPIVKCE